MRRFIASALALGLTSCTPTDSPSAPSPSDLSLASPQANEDMLRFVHPQAGDLLHAREPFPVILEQRIHGGPTQGRGELDASADGIRWRRIAQFPWSREATILRFEAILPAATPFLLRARIFSEGSSEPWIQSEPVRVDVRVAPPSPEDIAPGVRG